MLPSALYTDEAFSSQIILRKYMASFVTEIYTRLKVL